MKRAAWLLAVLGLGLLYAVSVYVPKGVHDVWRIGALDCTLQRASRTRGVLTVVVSVVNTSWSSQPVALRTGAGIGSERLLNEPWVWDASHDGVPATGTVYAMAGEPSAVTGGPPSGAPEMIAPFGHFVITDSFSDPGPGAMLAWAPMGTPSANFLNTAVWRLP
jgi:hypothetical protein